MRVFHRYVLHSDDVKLTGELARLGIACPLERRQFGELATVAEEFVVYEDDPAFTEKREALRRLGLESNGEGTEVSAAEEEAAAWHVLAVGRSGYPQPEPTWFQAAFGVDGTCRTCGYYDRQIAPFRFKTEPKAKHSQFLGLNWAFEPIFARDPVKELFEQERVSGVRFTRPVLHRTGAPLETVWQLEPEVRLAGGLRNEHLVDEPCAPVTDAAMRRFLAALGSKQLDGPFCGRSRHNHPTRGLMTFDADALKGAPDVVQTREMFGSGASSARVMLVKKRVRDLIMQQRLRGASFRPVLLV
jgi:hypothetical protein